MNNKDYHQSLELRALINDYYIKDLSVAFAATYTEESGKDDNLMDCIRSQLIAKRWRWA